MNRIEMCFEMEAAEDTGAEMGRKLFTDDQYKDFYRTFIGEVFSRFNRRERAQPFYMDNSDMRLWVSLGILYSTDEDQGTWRYGLTKAGATVRGWRQLKAVAEAHAAEMERRRKMIAGGAL